MEPTRATLDEYSSFICNPQKEGVWSIRIELSEKQASTLGSILNLDGHHLYFNRRPHHYYRGGIGLPYYRDDDISDRPPVLLPRLFAYLRTAIPKSERDGLPSLAGEERSFPPSSSVFKQRRVYAYLREILAPPNQIGNSKRLRLKRAAQLYGKHFVACKVIRVPEDIGKLDIACPDPLTYFQVAEEQGALRASSPCEATLNGVRDILEAVLNVKLETELTKIFSPESSVMGMYLPMLQLIPLSSILKARTAAGNVRQALDEAREERFVHAIRATGIAAEELLVEIYETYLREKAPEAPLGNIISDLSTRLQEVVHGAKVTKENPLGLARKNIGKAIEMEKRSANDPVLLLLAEQLQKNVISVLESLKQSIDDNASLNTRGQKISLFPENVRRCLSELVILRNRVSHRVERAVSIASVGYLDTAIALRDFIVVAKWWETERNQINYKATRKALIQETVKRSQLLGLDPEAAT